MDRPCVAGFLGPEYLNEQHLHQFYQIDEHGETVDRTVACPPLSELPPYLSNQLSQQTRNTVSQVQQTQNLNAHLMISSFGGNGCIGEILDRWIQHIQTSGGTVTTYLDIAHSAVAELPLLSDVVVITRSSVIGVHPHGLLPSTSPFRQHPSIRLLSTVLTARKEELEQKISLDLLQDVQPTELLQSIRHMLPRYIWDLLSEYGMYLSEGFGLDSLIRSLMDIGWLPTSQSRICDYFLESLDKAVTTNRGMMHSFNKRVHDVFRPPYDTRTVAEFSSSDLLLSGVSHKCCVTTHDQVDRFLESVTQSGRIRNQLRSLMRAHFSTSKPAVNVRPRTQLEHLCDIQHSSNRLVI